MSLPIAAVAQLCATSTIASNRQICTDLIRRAAAQGAKMIFMPEASDFIAEDKQATVALTTDLDHSTFIHDIQKAAKDNAIWVSVGVHEKSPILDHIYNTHVVIDSRGDIVSTYRKLHLFDVDIKDGPRLMESDTTLAGTKIHQPIETPLGKLGLQTCYDVRFAELAISQRRKGADILTYPSAFTMKTGLAHWEPLLRARAIETQTYVIASAQRGHHNAKRQSYGHAMIVDPWGTIVAACGDSEEPSLAFAPVDLSFLNKIRLEMPVMNHRRYDVYPELK
ncbi:Carbon-nitrogen hydrolase [Apophysomyces ossiformis]|uniref:Carbon-nitrogen hydrolase n=1 Tax=Apophysomyces ossiformis TaxID=679940 RepID=A0A8H7BTX1_9FUNG|nr:Carbon-nitrogen hydrolase [Apophysomyces ossiformis]